MAGTTIILDGPRGLAKSYLIDALQARLSDDDIVSQTIPIGLLHGLVESAPVRLIQQQNARGLTTLIDSDGLYDLVKIYYGPKEFDDYKTFDQAMTAALVHLNPNLVVIINSLPDEARYQNVRRGLHWESKQRNWLMISTISEVESVFEQIRDLVTNSADIKSKAPDSIASILNKKPIAAKIKQQKPKGTRARQVDKRERSR